MSDAISSVPLVTLLGAMDPAEFLSDSPVAQAPRPARQQPSPLGQDVELTLSAAALLESSKAASTLAQLAGNDGPQLASQLLSNLGSYPMPTPATARPASPAETLAGLKPHLLLNAPAGAGVAQVQPSGKQNELIPVQTAQLLASARSQVTEPEPMLISPLIDDPEKLAAATAQSLYLTYAEPLEMPPPAPLARKLLLSGVLLVALFLVLYLVR